MRDTAAGSGSSGGHEGEGYGGVGGSGGSGGRDTRTRKQRREGLDGKLIHLDAEFTRVAELQCAIFLYRERAQGMATPIALVPFKGRVEIPGLIAAGEPLLA